MKSILKRPWLISFGIIVASFAIAALALNYLAGDLKKQATKIVADQTLISRQVALLGILADLKRDAPIAATYSEAMKKLLPAHDDLIGFPQWMTGIANSHRVAANFAFQGANVAATTDTPGTDSFTIGATGAEADLLAFMEDLETKSAAYLLTVDSFDIGSDGNSARLSIQGRLFSSP